MTETIRDRKTIKGGSEIHKKSLKLEKSSFEDVSQASEFVKTTGVDSLAINIGNIHGVYPRPIRLNINLLEKIRKEIPVFLVLHGGSGTREGDVKKAVKNGIVKININTELRIAWKKSLAKSLQKDSVKPYDILPDVIEAIKEKTKEKIKLFGANKI